MSYDGNTFRTELHTASYFQGTLSFERSGSDYPVKRASQSVFNNVAAATSTRLCNGAGLLLVLEDATADTKRT